MLVVARKFNDIFYAISTKEWEMCDDHYLMMITYNLASDNYPMQNFFSKVFTVNTTLGKALDIKALNTIKTIMSNLDFDIMTISNISLISSSFIISNKKVKECILLEDGLMNYYDFKVSRRLSKVIVERLLGINYTNAISKIRRTYLLAPHEAVFYKGEPTKLELKTTVFKDNANLDYSIENKSIFVGQPLYSTSGMSIKEYSRLVNKAISDYNIDYYLPHRAALPGENIDCKVFDLNKTNATLEIYASCMTFKVYSFSSSVLYSTKFINPDIEAYAIMSDEMKINKQCDMIYKNVNEIIDLQL